MHVFFQSILHFIEFITSLPEHIIEPINFLPEFFKEALIDSLNLVPFLFVVFLLVEVIEQYFTKKKHLFIFFIKKNRAIVWEFVCLYSTMWLFCYSKYSLC